MTQEDKKYFHKEVNSEISYFLEKCLDEKEKVGICLLIAGTLFTALLLGQIGVEFIPFFINSSNLLNVIILLFLLLMIILISFIGVMIICDAIYVFSLLIIRIKRFICSYFKTYFESRQINSRKIRKFTFAIISGFFLLLLIPVSQMTVNNYPQVNIKLSFDEKIYIGKLIYNTGQGYILNIEENYIFVPYNKIEYINSGNPSMRHNIEDLF